MRILGIDPGSTATGYGVIERDGARFVHIAHGTLRPPRTASAARRLGVLHEELERVIESHSPDAAVVERIFVSLSASSALVLGQARGVALAALGGAGVPVFELAAREIKKSIVGTGAATKEQVQAMVSRLLSLSARPQPDAADALAAAIAHAQTSALAAIGVVGARRRRAPRAASEAQWLARTRS